MKRTTLTAVIIFTLIGIVFATTWYETVVKCPVCSKKNTFQQIGSYGSYIYHWPEKFEYIYWPVTETYSVYSCSNCRYSAFMWDFEHISGDTLQTIKAAIDTMSIDMKANKDYTKIPMYKKLETAEMFYKLYETDKDFWCKFYRIKAYHYDLDEMPAEARVNRLKALDIANEMLVDTNQDYRKKEILLISGAMKHFTAQDSLALLDFNLAKSLIYSDPQNDSSNNEGFNQYLDGIFIEYIELINAKDE